MYVFVRMDGLQDCKFLLSFLLVDYQAMRAERAKSAEATSSLWYNENSLLGYSFFVITQPY